MYKLKSVLLLFVILSALLLTISAQDGVSSPDNGPNNADSTTSASNTPLAYNSFDNANQNDFDNCVDGNTYDYIVVGVGQAGSVVAGRLAASGQYSVLGIEGGDRTHRSLNGTDYVAAKYNNDTRTGKLTVDPKPYTRFDVPLFSQSIYTAPTPYDEYPINMNGMIARSWTSRILGGSGAHNGMAWVRLTEATMNSWKVQGWSYNQSLPYYKKAENATGTDEGRTNPDVHGFSGPIGLTDVPNDPYYYPAFVFRQACINAGWPNNTDLNGRNPYGCGFRQANIKQGVRSNAANEYLPRPVRQGNLRLALNAVATKVLFKAVNGTQVVYGVRYFQNGQNKTAYARKEVILTPGAIFTAKLLQLSGIGNAALLRKYNIPVVYNNTNVGNNLCLNQLSYGVWNYFDNVTIPNGWGVNNFAQEYATAQRGLWSNNGNFAWAHLCRNTSQRCDNPDFLIGSNGAQFTAPGFKSMFVEVETAQPKQRGTVEISSSDPFAPPNVNLNLTGNAEDVQNLVAGWRALRKILKTYPANTIFSGELLPGPSVTDAQLEAYVMSSTLVSAHWTGTARMGNLGDPTAVVDPQLRVLGVSGLRVGDTSIYPSQNAGTSAQAVLAGERVACFILGC